MPPSAFAAKPSQRVLPTPALLIALFALLTSACTTPVSVRHMNPEAVHEILTRNVLSRGKLSLPTENLLRRLGVDEHYRKQPEAVIAAMHDRFVQSANRQSLEAQDALVALSEIAFQHAHKTDDPRYFLSSVAYAWAYLFPSREELRANPIDPRLRLAVNLYNRGLSRAFADPKSLEIAFNPGLHDAGFGRLNIRLADSEFRWGNRQLTTFTSVSELDVRGLRNRYRWHGLGAALSARTSPLNPGDSSDFLPDEVRVPVAAVMTFDDFDGQLGSGLLEARLHLRVAYASDTIDINGQSVPLEMEPTSSLAFMLTETDPWARELKGLLQGDLAIQADGLISLEPYHPGRIPIVLVHGTASSAARWADILNDLGNDRRVRENYQFWLFTYNTGAPIAYSAWRLRQAIRKFVDQIDPDHSDSALQRIVVAGHSQGGLLTKLTAVDSGNVFWDSISDLPFAEADLEPESREILGGSLFVKPVPEVERVVFISTPHRGSYLAEYNIARWMSRLVRAPANVVRAGVDFVSQNAEATAIRGVDRVDGAIGNMNPSSPFLAMLIDMPVAENVRSHSIISVKGGLAEPEESDGVVKYKSAHVDGVDSEFVVDSGHSCQSNPFVIAELRRILLEHIGENPAPVRPLLPN